MEHGGYGLIPHSGVDSGGVVLEGDIGDGGGVVGVLVELMGVLF